MQLDPDIVGYNLVMLPFSNIRVEPVVGILLKREGIVLYRSSVEEIIIENRAGQQVLLLNSLIRDALQLLNQCGLLLGTLLFQDGDQGFVLEIVCFQNRNSFVASQGSPPAHPLSA